MVVPSPSHDINSIDLFFFDLESEENMLRTFLLLIYLANMHEVKNVIGLILQCEAFQSHIGLYTNNLHSDMIKLDQSFIGNTDCKKKSSSN